MFNDWVYLEVHGIHKPFISATSNPSIGCFFPQHGPNRVLVTDFNLGSTSPEPPARFLFGISLNPSPYCEHPPYP